MKDKEITEWVEEQKSGNELMIEGVVLIVAALAVVVVARIDPILAFGWICGAFTWFKIMDVI